jgi:hypothetical protein
MFRDCIEIWLCHITNDHTTIASWSKRGRFSYPRRRVVDGHNGVIVQSGLEVVTNRTQTQSARHMAQASERRRGQ